MNADATLLGSTRDRDRDPVRPEPADDEIGREIADGLHEGRVELRVVEDLFGAEDTTKAPAAGRIGPAERREQYLVTVGRQKTGRERQSEKHDAHFASLACAGCGAKPPAEKFPRPWPTR